MQEIKKEAKTQQDEESIKDIEWIIDSLNEGNIYELDPLYLQNENLSDLNSEENQSGLNFLMQYSKIEDLKMKTKDFNAALNIIKTKVFSPNYEIIYAIALGYNEEQESVKRKINIENVDNIISAILNRNSKITLSEIVDKAWNYWGNKPFVKQEVLFRFSKLCSPGNSNGHDGSFAL